MIYVDELREYTGTGRWCHMMTDGDPDELKEFAFKIGLRVNWLQENRLHPHYDLRPSMREKAIKAGARPVSSEEMVRKCSKLLRGRG